MRTAIHIDVVSDVMCPWCAIAFASLNRALEAMDEQVSAYIRFQPFELNPEMAAEGQNLREHLKEKYGSTDEESANARAHIEQMGEQLGFEFNFRDDTRMYNTFNAQQLLHWAESEGKQPQLKAALFEAYFRDGRDVSDVQVLLDVAAATGLDKQEAEAVIADQRFAETVRALEQQWREMGVHSVPAVILQEKYLLSGAQAPDAYVKAISQLILEQQSAE